MAASMMLFRSMAKDVIPNPVRDYLLSTLRQIFRFQSGRLLTLVIEENNGIGRNQVYDDSQIYLCTKISPDAERLKVVKSPKEKNLSIRLEKGETIHDSFEGIDLKWSFICAETQDKRRNDDDDSRNEKRYLELTFDKRHKENVLSSYLPFVLRRSKEIKDQMKVIKLCTLRSYNYGSPSWDSIFFEHPSTFDTLAIDPELKRSIIEDLDRFVKRKDFYKKVGKTWKRGYLLYGPPGTGKSSLIAAMANYLKFDVYDLQLGNLTSDSDLRRLLLATANRSILVIEDIDCSVKVPDRQDGDESKRPIAQLTLSGLLNFIDGLWSSCGDERIIIFTTNNKDKLDPALLRPGRMDMHIHMSYCMNQGFKLLASNYLGISGHHMLFEEIESRLENAEVTPAQVAEELMKSDVAEVALGELVKLLKRKTMEVKEMDDKAENKVPLVEAKRQKIIKNEQNGGVIRRKRTRRRN